MIKVCSLNTNVEDCGSGENVVFLHGWGSDLTDFLGSAKVLSKNYRTINLDLWGFGKSDKPHSVWGIEEYAKALDEFFKKSNLKQFHLVGHSFGGKIAIKYTFLNPQNVKSLTLVDSAGIKNRFSILNKLKIHRYKKLKKQVLLGKRDKAVLEKFGSTDFKNSGGIMKQIMVKVINQNVEFECKQIKTKTLIVWGKQDKDTPLYMAKKLNKLIKNSSLKIFQGGHFSHIDNFLMFNNSIQKFWGNL